MFFWGPLISEEDVVPKQCWIPFKQEKNQTHKTTKRNSTINGDQKQDDGMTVWHNTVSILQSKPWS